MLACVYGTPGDDCEVGSAASGNDEEREGEEEARAYSSPGVSPLLLRVWDLPTGMLERSLRGGTAAAMVRMLRAGAHYTAVDGPPVWNSPVGYNIGHGVAGAARSASGSGANGGGASAWAAGTEAVYNFSSPVATGPDRPLEGVWVQPGAPYLIANVRTLLEPTTVGLSGRGARRRRRRTTAATDTRPSPLPPTSLLPSSSSLLSSSSLPLASTAANAAAKSFFAAAAAEEGGEEADALRLAAAATHAWGRDADVDAVALPALIPSTLHGAHACAPRRTSRARVGAGGALTLAMPAHRGTTGSPSHALDLDGTSGSDNTERTLALAAVTRRAAALAPAAMAGCAKALESFCDAGMPRRSSATLDAAIETTADESEEEETEEELQDTWRRRRPPRQSMSSGPASMELVTFARYWQAPCAPLREAAQMLFAAAAAAALPAVLASPPAAFLSGSRVAGVEAGLPPRPHASPPPPGAASVSTNNNTDDNRDGSGDSAGLLAPWRVFECSSSLESWPDGGCEGALGLVVAAAACLACPSRPRGDGGGSSGVHLLLPSCVAPALVELLRAPHAVHVADAASLLAEGVRRCGWWDLLSDVAK